jgi:hypothetical protein
MEKHLPGSVRLELRTCQTLAVPSRAVDKRYGVGWTDDEEDSLTGGAEKDMLVIGDAPCGRGNCVFTIYLIRVSH